jgi:hypothetical protein
MDGQMWEGYEIYFKWHTNVKLRNTNEDSCIDTEGRGMGITMHAATINRRAAQRDRTCMNIKI